MIDPALLERLRDADPETYAEYAGSEMNDCDVTDEKDIIYLEELSEEVQDAWLQHVLQKAIWARKWHLLQSQEPATCMYYAEISKIALGYAGDHYTEHCLWLIGSGEANLPKNALLKAYLVAIESWIN